MSCSPLKTAKPSLWTYLLRCMMLFSHLLRQYEPTKSLADKWHWKFKLPSPLLFFLFSFSFYFWIIDFFVFSFLFFMTYLNGTLPHRGEKKKTNTTTTTRCAHMLRVGDTDGTAEWPLDLSEWDQTAHLSFCGWQMLSWGRAQSFCKYRSNWIHQ